MPRLSADAILAALALAFPLAAGGCSKAERAAPEAPPPATQTEAPPTAAATPLATAPSPGTASAAAVETDPKPATADVDAGTELKVSPPSKGAHASCGAAGCSPEMRKGK